MEQATYIPDTETKRPAVELIEDTVERLGARNRIEIDRHRHAEYVERIDSTESLAHEITEWMRSVQDQISTQKEKLAQGEAEPPKDGDHDQSSDWHYDQCAHWSQVANSAVQKLRDSQEIWSDQTVGSDTASALGLELIHMRRMAQNALNALARSVDHNNQYLSLAADETKQSSSHQRLMDTENFISEYNFDSLESLLSSHSYLAYQHIWHSYSEIGNQLSERFHQTSFSGQRGDINESSDAALELAALWPEFLARNQWLRSIEKTNKTIATAPNASFPEIHVLEPFGWNFDLDKSGYAGLIAGFGEFVEQTEDLKIHRDEAQTFIDEMSNLLVDTLDGAVDSREELEMSEANEVLRALNYALPQHFTTWLLLAAYLDDDGLSRYWENLGNTLKEYSIEQLIPDPSSQEIALCQELTELTEDFDFLDPDQWGLRQKLSEVSIKLVATTRQRSGQSLATPISLQVALSSDTQHDLLDPIRAELMSSDQLNQPLLQKFAMFDAVLRMDSTLLNRVPTEKLTLNLVVDQIFDTTDEGQLLTLTADQVTFLTNELPLSLATDSNMSASKAIDCLLHYVPVAESMTALKIVLNQYPEFRDRFYLNDHDFRLSALVDLHIARSGLLDWMVRLAEESPSSINSAIVEFFSEVNQMSTHHVGSILSGLKNVDDHPEEVSELLREKVVLIKEFESVSSAELLRLKDQILEQLLSVEESKAKLDQIKLIFEQNNTPDVAKIFLVFQTLFPREEFAAQLNDRSSPVLRHAGHRQRYAIIFRDLLKVHIESGSPNLYAYLESLRDNQNLIDAISSTELAATSSASRQQLSRFLRRLEALSAASSRPHSVDTSIDPSDLYERLTHLRAALGASEGQSLSDRIVEMYGKSLGYQTIDEILHRGEEAAAVADQRNRNQILEDGNWVQIKSGDLLKGIKHEFTASMAANGVVAKEYLGASSESDSTPYDTDLSLVDDIEAESNQSALAGSLARGYGDIIIGFHDRGQFYKTDALEQPNIYESKYELFTSGFHGDKHMGIRTGVPFTAVDYILIDRENMAAASVDRLIFTIAQLPYYVPVADHDGLLLFSPEDIDSWRIDYQKITELFNDPKIDGQAVVKALSRVWYLGQQYDASAGVSEGYTLGEHTAMVIDQFNKYYNQAKESGPSESWLPLTREEFTLLLALHDIGKPEGIRIHGSTTAQHQHSQELVSLLLANSPFSYDKRELMTSMVSQDYVGEHFKDNVNVDVTADRIKHMAAQHGIDVRQLLPLLLMYYTSDAGAYTSDAGGAPSLDRLFTFNNQGDSIPTATLNPPLDEKWDALWQAATA